MGLGRSHDPAAAMEIDNVSLIGLRTRRPVSQNAYWVLIAFNPIPCSPAWNRRFALASIGRSQFLDTVMQPIQAALLKMKTRWAGRSPPRFDLLVRPDLGLCKPPAFRTTRPIKRPVARQHAAMGNFCTACIEPVAEEGDDRAAVTVEN